MYILQPLMKDGAMLVVKFKRDGDAAGQVLKKNCLIKLTHHPIDN